MIGLSLLLTVLSMAAHAQKSSSAASVAVAIERHVLSFIEQHHADADDIEVRLLALDPRLSLPACGSELLVGWTVPGHDTG